MKLRILFTIACTIIIGTAGITAAGMNQHRRGGQQDGLQNAAITNEEAEGIRYMRQEEKLARDVYITLNAQWDEKVFANISQSEQKHMDAVLRLIEAYGLEDPAADDTIGVYEDEGFVALYTHFTEMGSQSVEDAFNVGIAIEEADIADLEEKIAQATKRNVIRVFENLLEGSKKHLAAFEKNLTNDDCDGECQQVASGQQLGKRQQNRSGNRNGNGTGQGNGNGNGNGRGRGNRNGTGRGNGNGQGRGKQNQAACSCDQTCKNA